MRRFFAKNILFVVAVNLLVKPVWIFLIDRTVQNRVGHDYGSYQALFNLGIIFQILLDFGINNYTSKTIAEHPENIREIFPALLSARVLLGLLYIVVVFSIAFALGYHGSELLLLAGISAIQLLNSTLQFIRSNVSGLHKFRLDGILSVSDKLLMIGVCGFLLVYHKTDFKITWFVEAQVICYLLAIIFGLVALKKISKISVRFSSHYKTIWLHVKKSFPYALLIFLMSIYTRADMLMVERICGVKGKEEASIYAAAFRLLDVGNMIGLMFAVMLLPIFGGMIARKENLKELVRLSVNILLPVSFLVMIMGIFFRSEIMQRLNPALPSSKALVFAWLMAAFPAFSISNVYSTLLTANGNLKLMNRIAFFGVVVNLVLNVILIQYFNAVGAAVTAFITQTFVALIFLFSAKKELVLQEDFRWGFSFFFYIVLLVFIAFIIRSLVLPWGIQFIITGLAGFAMIFLLRFIEIKQLRKLMQRSV